MTTVDLRSDLPKGQSGERNAILRLWYDKRSRSVILQILTMALLFGFFAYIGSNAVANLKLLGKTFSFEFPVDGSDLVSFQVSTLLEPFP